MDILEFFGFKRPAKGNKLEEAFFRHRNPRLPVMGITTDAETIIANAYAKNADVYAVVNIVLKAAMNVPEIVYEEDAAAAKARAKQHALRAKGVHVPIQVLCKELREITDKNIIERLASPNPQQSAAELKEMTLLWLMTLGNAYEYAVILKGGANAGFPHEVYAVPPQMVRIIPDRDSLGMVGGYEFGHYKNDVPASDVMHLKLPNPSYVQGQFAHLYGLSPLYAARYVIEQSNAGADTMWNLLNSAGLKGVFSKPAAQEDGLTPEQARAVRDMVNDPARALNYIGVPLDYHALGLSPVDMDLLAGMQATKRSICDIYGVNSALLNDPENKTYNNMAEARKALYTNAAMPLLERYRNGRQRWLMPMLSKTKRYVLEHDYSVIPELQEDVTKLYAVLKDVWYLTADERRAITGYAEMGTPESTQLMVPSSYVPGSELDAALDDAAKQLDFARIHDYE